MEESKTGIDSTCRPVRWTVYKGDAKPKHFDSDPALLAFYRGRDEERDVRAAVALVHEPGASSQQAQVGRSPQGKTGNA